MPLRSVTLLAIATIAPGLPAAGGADCQVRVLATDPATADQLRENLSRETFNEVLDGWIRAGRVREIVRAESDEPGLLNLKEERGEGEQDFSGHARAVPLGAELRVSSGSFLEDSRSLAIHFTTTSAPAARALHTRSLQTTVDLPTATWASVGQLDDPDSRTATLVIARDAREAEGTPDPAFAIAATIEIYRLQEAGLRTLSENLDGREAAAAAWLRRESKALRSFRLGYRPGDRSIIRDTLAVVAREGDTTTTGLTLGIQPHASVLGGGSGDTPPRSFGFSAEFSGDPWSSDDPVRLEGEVPLGGDAPSIFLAPEPGEDGSLVVTVSPTVELYPRSAPDGE